MRVIKTIKINDLELTIRELTVRQIWQLLQKDSDQVEEESEISGFSGMSGKFESLLAMSCPELKKEAAFDMAPSEIAQIWKVFEEVNASFLELARKFGLQDMIKNEIGLAMEKAREELTGQSASS